MRREKREVRFDCLDYRRLTHAEIELGLGRVYGKGVTLPRQERRERGMCIVVDMEGVETA